LSSKKWKSICFFSWPLSWMVVILTIHYLFILTFFFCTKFNDENQIFFRLLLDGQLWSSITYSFQQFSEQSFRMKINIFFLDFSWMANFDHPSLIHFNSFFNNFFPLDFYLSQSFYNKMSTTSQSKSSDICNLESCPKLKSLNFQWWYIFHLSYKCAFFENQNI
jgi:hypothetical protein